MALKRLTCREASRYLSQGLDAQMTLGERVSLRLHLTLCDACSRLKAQFAFLRRALGAYAERGADRDDRR